MADMTQDYGLRPLTEDDVGAVMGLERDLFRGDAWTEGMLRSELVEPTRHYIVAVHTREVGAGTPSEVVGYAGLRSVPPEGDVQTIAVAQSHWGNGVGAALLTELLDQAHSRGVTEMFLDVRADNPRAQELYRRFGFTEIGTRRNYYWGADAVVMRRLAPLDAQSDEERRKTW